MTWDFSTELSWGTYGTPLLYTPSHTYRWEEWDGFPTDIFLVPCVSFNNSKSYQSFQSPYGYVNINGYLIFSSHDGIHYGINSYPSSSNETAINAVRVPLISEAENAFMLGISKRSEPVIDGGGG